MQDYYRRGYANPFSGITPAVRVLLLATLGAYVLQLVLALAGLHLSVFFGLSLFGLRHGMIWQPVTYMFMHAEAMPLHVIFNMLILFFLGPETERAMGARTFVKLYLGAGVLGGIGWLVISGTWDAVCVGASGAVLGVLAAFATLYPHRRITLLLFFILPLTMQAWVMAVGLGVIELLFLLSGVQAGAVANAAHLAGGVAGFLYTRRFIHRSSEAPRPVQVRRGRPPPLTVLKGKRTPPPPTREEIDRLLEKIAGQGMDSLTPAERKALEQASESLRNRTQ